MKLPDVVYFQTLVPDSNQMSQMWASLLGALLGGMLVFLTQFYFERRRRRIEYNERDFELYLHISEAINDAHGIGSTYFRMLGRESWPVDPLSEIRPVLSRAVRNVNANASLLATFVGKSAENLTHEFYELQNLRNIIIETNNEFLASHTAMITEGSRFVRVGPGMSLTGALDPTNPDHQLVIVRADQTRYLLKQLLSVLLDFFEHNLVFVDNYNKFKENHKYKASRRLKISLVSIESYKDKFYINSPTA